MTSARHGMEYVYRLQTTKWHDKYPCLPNGLLVTANSDEEAHDGVRHLLEQIGVETPSHQPADWHEVYYLSEVFILDDDRFCPHRVERTMNGCEECHAEEATAVPGVDFCRNCGSAPYRSCDYCGGPHGFDNPGEEEE